MRSLQRKVEAVVGGKLIDLAMKDSLKRSKLIRQKVFLPKHDVYMHYLERIPSSPSASNRKGNGNNSAATTSVITIKNGQECNGDDNSNSTPVILFCHGLSDSAENMAGFIHSLNIPENIRIIVPDQFGHGKDLERAKLQPETYQHPTQSTLLESTCEFLDVLDVGSNVNCFGISLGGALAYYLRVKRPDKIKRTVLISPSLEYCIDNGFINDFVEGKKRHFCFEERADVKYLFRDLSTGCENSHKRKRKDPIPKFFLEAIYRTSAKNVPHGHYKGMLHGFIDEMGKRNENEENQNIFNAQTDIDPGSPRLVLWPDHDYICDLDKGREFFSESENTVFETIADCGHVFHADGTIILLIDWVQEKIRNCLIDFSPSPVRGGEPI